ncbi:hypothetical protein [Terrisporobacter glycolicus]|uniref:t-SNARE coiled-coil homology domain-containing protein n=1 Tax=Terrisporobacter glycolicus ATCC 14880 = DSM 1288 TaxID=1121315 RepID=A0ABZ2EVB3_9FIRM|nr:hypothetical protein [Terrisporobacter glycolicus]
MSEARKLVEVIDQLEKQSEELNSAIDLYTHIDNLYAKVSNTSLKYEKVFDDMDKAKSYLKDASKNIKNNLENTNYEEKLENIRLHIDKLNSNTINLSNDIINIIASLRELNENDKLFKEDIRNTNNNIDELYKVVSSLKDQIEINKSDYNDKLDESLNNLKDEIIESLNKKMSSMEEAYNKHLKNIYIGLGVVLIISIVNIFI